MDPIFFQIILFALAASPQEELDSVTLANEIKRGNHDAFQSFFDAHYEALLRFLLSKGLSREDGKDIIQQAFIYIWDHRQKIEPEKSLRAYIFRIAYTRMLNLFRDNKKFETSETAQEHTRSIDTPQNEIQHSEVLQLIHQTIARMPERRSMVFDLCFMQEFTYKETAKVLDISVKTVENHMGLALKDVRKALKNHGLSPVN